MLTLSYFAYNSKNMGQYGSDTLIGYIQLQGQTVQTNGDPLNTHCECAAGRGPHGTCKHVAVVCIMLSNFTESGTMKIAKSSRENLMSSSYSNTESSIVPQPKLAISSKSFTLVIVLILRKLSVHLDNLQD